MILCKERYPGLDWALRHMFGVAGLCWEWDGRQNRNQIIGFRQMLEVR
jgi:hypothetical protein